MSKLTKLSIFFLTAALVLVLSGIALAQDESTITPETDDQPANFISPSPNTDESAATEVVEEVTLDETVASEDLGMKEPNLLPDSKFYFLKNWRRALKSAVTFNPVKKAELKLKYASEKLLEARKLADKNKRPKILEKAAEKYQAEIEKVKQAADKIKETAAENPKVGEFLNKFVKQQILHDKILEKLEEKVPEGALEKIKAARERHLENFGEVMQKLEDKEGIGVRLENVVQNIQGSDFKDIKSLEVLKRLEEKAPEAIKEQIQQVQEKVLQNLKEKVQSMPPEKQEKLQNYLENIKGVAEKKAEIINDLKNLLPETVELKQKLENIKERVLNKQATTTRRFGNECVCTIEYAPACGEDGKTYGNPCKAKCQNIEIISQGPCVKTATTTKTTYPKENCDANPARFKWCEKDQTCVRIWQNCPEN